MLLLRGIQPIVGGFPEISQLKRCMNREKNKTPLQGITLEQVLNSLFEKYGWEELGRRVKIRCFTSDPSIKSSLTFLRKTPWARKKVENLYIALQKKTRKSTQPTVTAQAKTWCQSDKSIVQKEQK
jgi:uncharacterized protein (DUF2132 family)